MPKALSLCALFLFLVAAPGAAQTVARADIQAFGTGGRADHRPDLTIDGSAATFWQGTAAIAAGGTDVLAYRFAHTARITGIDFANQAQRRYAMGALEIQVSQDSTNGQDGVWTTVDSVPPDFDPPGGAFTRSVTMASTRWVRLRMTNRGRGLQDGAFGLSEVSFHGETAGGDQGGQAAPPTFSTEVVVTASRAEQRLVDAPVSMSVIDARQIEASPAGNVADLLRGVPGLNVIQLSARDISITGRMATTAFAQGQLVLVDGRSIVNDPNGIAFWDMMPVRFDELAQVEVLHGPGSSVWGGDALTAVVNLRTKTPREMPGGLFKVSFGEVGTRAASARWSGAHDAWSYKFSGSYFRQDGWPRPATLPSGAPMPADFAYKNPPTSQPRFDVRVDRDGADNRRWSFRAGYARTSGALLAPQLPLQFSFLYSFNVDATYTTPGMDARVQYRRLVGHALSLLDGSPSNAISNTPAADVTFRRVLGTRQVLIFGGSMHDDFFDIAAAPKHTSRFQAGGFIDDGIELSSKVWLDLGGRLDYIQTTGAAFSPRASVLVKPVAETSFRFAYSRAYRSPTLIENYLYVPFSFNIDLGLAQPVPISSLSAGSETLHVARSDGVEVGVTRVVAARHAIVATFYRLTVKDQIAFGTSQFYGPADPPPGWPLPASTVPPGALPKLSTFRNVGSLRSQGVELSLDSNWSDHAWSRVSYTFQDTPKLSDAVAGFPTAVNIPSAHQWSILAGASDAEWRGSLGATYVARAYWSDALDARFWGYTPSYLLVNASIAKKFPAQRSEIALDASNLLNKRAQQHAFGDLIGRRVVVEYRFMF
jgi:outer membrane receptor protein involved in Fe transport